jgi:hypothetical protein
MNDKDWLDKVSVAYKVYQKEFNLNSIQLNHFISWLYSQYGIIPPKDRK